MFIVFVIVIGFLILLLFVAPKYFNEQQKVIERPQQSKPTILNDLFDEQRINKPIITFRGQGNEIQMTFLQHLKERFDVISIGECYGFRCLNFETEQGPPVIVRSLKPFIHIDNTQYENLQNYVNIVAWDNLINSPSTDRLRSLQDKWTNIRQGIDRERYEKKEVIDTHIAKIEQQLNQEKPKEEIKFKTLKDHILKLQDAIYLDKNERESFDELKQKDLRIFEDHLQQLLEDEKNNKRKVELQLLKQIEERFTTMQSSLMSNNNQYKDKTNKTLQNISLQMSELRITLENETQVREESQNSLVEQIDSQINAFQDVISIERQVREETQKKIFNMIEDIHSRIQTELRTEKIQRETTVDQLLKVLEDTCIRIDEQFN
ncbi:hypothetical protein pb186bvf_007506 [Paramecium bursaria]